MIYLVAFTAFVAGLVAGIIYSALVAAAKFERDAKARPTKQDVEKLLAKIDELRYNNSH